MALGRRYDAAHILIRRRPDQSSTYEQGPASVRVVPPQSALTMEDSREASPPDGLDVNGGGVHAPINRTRSGFISRGMHALFPFLLVPRIPLPTDTQPGPDAGDRLRRHPVVTSISERAIVSSAVVRRWRCTDVRWFLTPSSLPRATG